MREILIVRTLVGYRCHRREKISQDVVSTIVSNGIVIYELQQLSPLLLPYGSNCVQEFVTFTILDDLLEYCIRPCPVVGGK